MGVLGSINVQSIAAGVGGKPVVATILANSAVIQWVAIADVVGAVAANVKSYASGAGVLVVPINTNGDPIHFPALADYRSAVSAVITDSADHALLAGLTGKRFYAGALTISAESVGGLVSLKDSGGIVWTGNIPPQDVRHFPFPVPIRSTLASSLVVAFQNSGAQGTVSVTGFDA